MDLYPRDGAGNSAGDCVTIQFLNRTKECLRLNHEMISKGVD